MASARISHLLCIIRRWVSHFTANINFVRQRHLKAAGFLKQPCWPRMSYLYISGCALQEAAILRYHLWIQLPKWDKLGPPFAFYLKLLCCQKTAKVKQTEAAVLVNAPNLNLLSTLVTLLHVKWRKTHILCPVRGKPHRQTKEKNPNDRWRQDKTRINFVIAFPSCKKK